MGFNLFVLQGMTGRQLPRIARVALPMFLLMAAAVLLIYFVPGLVTWSPGCRSRCGCERLRLH